MKRFILFSLITTVILNAVIAPVSSALVAKPYVVSIGDSVAAGTGLPTASGQQNHDCKRSKQAYGYEVARQIGASKILQVACNGAKIDEGVYGNQISGSLVKSPQLDTAFAYGKPDIMLVTIGANDMRWRYFAGKCLEATCGTTADKALATAYWADLYYELPKMIYEIDKRSNGVRPQIMISGYYNPLADVSCVDSSAVTPTELQWLEKQVNRLNSAIRETAAIYNNVEYVPIDFSGHGLCSSDPWVQPISRTDPGALHPTANGQKAMARAFLQEIKD